MCPSAISDIYSSQESDCSYSFTSQSPEMNSEDMDMISDEPEPLVPSISTNLESHAELCRLCTFELLLHDVRVSSFLKSIPLFDRYFVSSVSIYFNRIEAKFYEYTAENFFYLLHLTSDLLEDNYIFQEAIELEAFGPRPRRNYFNDHSFEAEEQLWKQNRKSFYRRKQALWKRMKYRCCVSMLNCDEILSFTPNPQLWGKVREISDIDYLFVRNSGRFNFTLKVTKNTLTQQRPRPHSKRSRKESSQIVPDVDNSLIYEADHSYLNYAEVQHVSKKVRIKKHDQLQDILAQTDVLRRNDSPDWAPYFPWENN